MLDQPNFSPRARTPEGHPDASLLTAEEVSVAGLWRIIGEAGEDGSYKATTERAWAFVELALATPDTENDGDFFGEARKIFAAHLNDHGDRPHHPAAYSARLFLAFEKAFRSRAKHSPVTSTLTDHTYQKVAVLLERTVSTQEPNSHTTGQRAELVLASTLLRSGWMPYPGSHREEGNEGIWDNHDFYLISGTQKAPLQVKNHSSKHDNESILTIFVGPTVCRIIKDSPEFADKLDGLTNTELREAGVGLVAELIIRETVGQEMLLSHETELLSRLGENFAEQAENFLLQKDKITSHKIGELAAMLNRRR